MALTSLRIRSPSSKQTSKLQLPSSSSLEDLKIAIAAKINSDNQFIHLSLNRKDELLPAPDETLQSIGLVSGDLIYYTVSPIEFHSQLNSSQENSFTQLPSQELVEPLQNRQQVDKVPCGSDPVDFVIHGDDTVHGDKIATVNHCLVENSCNQEKAHQGKPFSLMRSADEKGKEKAFDMEACSFFCRGSNFVLHLLCKVLEAENININGNINNLLVACIHAVLLESGFMSMQSTVDVFSLPQGWVVSTPRFAPLEYILPGATIDESGQSNAAVIRFVTLGQNLSIYGLTANPSSLCHLILDASLFAPSIDFVFINRNCLQQMYESVHAKRVFELWRIVKDNLSLPLLIVVCEKVGLHPPACFMLLPAELKTRILEFLTGRDIAIMACICSELQDLTSNDDLWKRKCGEEFQIEDKGNCAVVCWKKKFVTCRMKQKVLAQRRPSRVYRSAAGPYSRGPTIPFGFPSPFIGGGNDRFPATWI